MGDNVEVSDPGVSKQKTKEELLLLCQNTSDASQNIIASELLSAETRRQLQNLLTASDGSIDDAEFDAAIDKVIDEIYSKQKIHRSENKKQRYRLHKKRNAIVRKAQWLQSTNPSEASKLQKSTEVLDSQVNDLINLNKNVLTERVLLVRKLHSLRKSITTIDITEFDDPIPNLIKEDDNIDNSDSAAFIKRSLEIVENNLPTIPTKNTVIELVSDETKNLIQYLTTVSLANPNINPAEHNAKISVAITEIIACVQQHHKTLRLLSNLTRQEKNKIHNRAKYAKEAGRLEDEKIHLNTEEALAKKVKEADELSSNLLKEKDDMVKRLNSKLKAVPIEKPGSYNAHVNPTPSACTKLSVAFEGQPATAIVTGNKKAEPARRREENAFLSRLIRLRKQELMFSEKQRSLGRQIAERTHVAVYQQLEAIITLVQPLLEPKNLLLPKYKLLDLLLEKYPPRVARVEVTLDAAYIDQLATEQTAIAGFTGEFKPLQPNTTIVTTSDGGSQDENERNFTRRLNTVIEFELGQARNATANKNFFNAKANLATASALIARSAGVKELLDQLVLEPDFIDLTEEDDLLKGLAEAKVTELLVDNIIRSLHIQIGENDEVEQKEPLISSLDREALFNEATRFKKYFTQESLAEFIEGRDYSSLGNLLLAGHKCIIGNDLAEKSAHLNHSIQKKDLVAQAYCVQKYKALVPPDFAPEPTKPPVFRYVVPRDPVVPDNKGVAGPQPTSSSVTPQSQKLSKPLLPTPANSGRNVLKSFSLLLPRDFNNPSSGPSGKQNAAKPQGPPQNIQKPNPNNWYPARFDPTPKSNMDGQNKFSGEASNIQPSAGQNQWQPVQSSSSASGIQILSSTTIPASSNIVMKMLPGKAPAQPVSQQSPVTGKAIPQVMGQPNLQEILQRKSIMLSADPIRLGKVVLNKEKRERKKQRKAMQVEMENLQRQVQPVQMHHPTMGMNIHQQSQPHGTMGITINHSYPKGIPRSFLHQQEQQMNTQNNPGELTQLQSDNMPIWPTQSGFQQPMFTSTFTEAPSSHTANPQMFAQTERPMYVQTEPPMAPQTTQYSPTEVYGGHGMYEDEDLDEDETGDGSQSPTTGQKRLSAFQRLGPVTAPKKPKLTINLLFSKDDSVREVVDDEADRSNQPDQLIPVPKRHDILNSTDETVTNYLASWPWLMKFAVKRQAAPRTSKSVMIMEEEQMMEGYESNRHYIKVTISKFPPYYKKEDVLDLVLETVTGKSFIPCFIEFTREECTFLVLRSLKALLTLHKKGLYLHENGHDMPVQISTIDLTLNHIGFIPRIVLGKRLTAAYDGEMRLDLEAFCLKSDISHFMYFPLNRPTNQTELVQLQSGVSWEHLRVLSLAKNRLTTLEGFELARRCPKLKKLDLSNNCIERVTVLLCCRGLALHSLRLEGNPLCTDYTDPGQYVAVVRMIFPTLTELDGVEIHLPGSLPPSKQNYCPPDARRLVDTLLSVHCPLLDAPPEDRAPIEELYHERAVLTITYCHRLRYRPIFRQFRDLFTRCRLLEEENLDSVEGAAAVAKHVSRWPPVKHDPYSFVVDVLHYDETNAIVRVSGVLKITSETLAEDEPLLAFTRTVVLRALNGAQYRIHNEMLYWDEPTAEQARQAFQFTTIRPKKLSLKMESAPDEDLKSKLIAIFMKVTNLNRKLSERCLEIRNWDFKTSLEYFMKLLKLNSLDTLDVAEG